MPRLCTSVLGTVGPLLVLLLGGSAPGLQSAEGHAVMIEPQTRPWLTYLQQYNYLPHQVFAGGTKAISQNETLRYPAMHRSGVCGDAYGETRWSKPGNITATYKAGAKINVDIVFAQNHLGRYEVRLCPLDAQDEAKDCTPLHRADGGGPAVYLPMTPNWHGVTSGFVAPANETGQGITMYKMETWGRDKGCKAWACDQFKDMFVYRTEWKLPNKAKCEHCMLQFFYMTGSRCWPPCLEGSKDCIKNPMEYGICGEEKTSYPELFFNCADVSIH